MTEKALCSLLSFNRFKTPRLSVTAELAGRSLTFSLGEHNATIRLPDPIAADGEDRLDLNVWREMDGQRFPLEYRVLDVDLNVSVPGIHALPAGVLEKPPNAIDILSRQDEEVLMSLASSQHAVAYLALDRWLRTVRWKTGRPMVGREISEGLETGWGTALVDSKANKRVWVQHETIVILRSDPITLDQWTEIEASLRKGLEPPVFVDLLFDAMMHFTAGDLRRAVVDAAVAAETYIRMVIRNDLPGELGDKLRELIDEANIRPVMTKVFPETLERCGQPVPPKAIMSDIHALLDVRNKMLHLGHHNSLDRTKCEKFLDAVGQLIAAHIG